MVRAASRRRARPRIAARMGFDMQRGGGPGRRGRVAYKALIAGREGHRRCRSAWIFVGNTFDQPVGTMTVPDGSAQEAGDTGRRGHTRGAGRRGSHPGRPRHAGAQPGREAAAPGHGPTPGRRRGRRRRHPRPGAGRPAPEVHRAGAREAGPPRGRGERAGRRAGPAAAPARLGPGDPGGVRSGRGPRVRVPRRRGRRAIPSSTGSTWRCPSPRSPIST